MGANSPTAQPPRFRRICSKWRDESVRAGATKALLLPITSVAALVVAHLQIAAVGVVGFGILTLLLTITTLLPFADLGVGAAVTNATSSGGDPNRMEQVVVASFRLLAVTAAVLLICGSALTTLRLWDDITGVRLAEVPNLNRDMFFVVALFCLGIPLGLGARILLGIGRYPLLLVMQASGSLIVLATVFGFRHSRSMTPFLLAPFFAQVMVAAAVMFVALRSIGLRPWALLRFRLARDLGVGREIATTAAPMFFISLALPFALQTDRLVLSHVSGRGQLSDYAIVSMLYLPTWAIISSAGMTLWPRFNMMRGNPGHDGRARYLRALKGFLALGATGAICLAMLGPFVTMLWAGRRGGTALWLAFAILLIVQAGHLPAAMYLTSSTGLRFQALCVAGMCVANVPLSVWLAANLGAVGPVVASAVTIFCFQLLPGRRFVMRGYSHVQHGLV